MGRSTGGIIRGGTAALACATLVVALAAAPGAAGKPSPKQPSAACRSLIRGLFGAASVRVVTGAVPASTLAPYAVFTRPQAPSDTPPPPSGGPSLSAVLGSQLQSYDPADTRLVATLGTTSLYLIAGVARDLTVPAHCRRSLPAAALPLLTILHYQARQLGTGPAYCLLTASPATAITTTSTSSTAREDYVGAQCFSFAGVTTGFEASATLDDSAGLVPDGVGAVEIRIPIEPSPVTLAVQNNVASGPVPSPPPKIRRELATALRKPHQLGRVFNEILPTSITWLTAPGGTVVRTFPRPAGLLDETVAEARASEKLLTSAVSQNCVSSQSPGHPPKQHCTTIKTHG